MFDKLSKIKRTTEKVEKLRPEYMKLSDESLQAKTSEFKARLSKGESLESLLPEVYAAVREASRRVLGLEPFPVQIMAGVALNDGNVVEAKTGEGKALPCYSRIPTPEGWKLCGNIKKGDFLFGRDGKPTKVTGVYPQGKKEVYEVTLKDGRTVETADDHLWTVEGRKEPVTTKEMFDTGTRCENGFLYRLPLPAPVEYDEKPLPEDPYEYGRKAEGKIEEMYLLSSVSQRQALLQGMMDERGGSFSNGNLVYITSSNILRRDFMELVYSLGFSVSYTSGSSGYVIETEVPDEKKKDFFRDERKKEALKKNTSRVSDCVAVSSVRKTGMKTSQVCFYVDNPEHLFLTGDYVVTHNTLVAAMPSYLNALTGKPVHVVTVNDYLAKRDADEIGKIHSFLGLTTGCVLSQMPVPERKENYACDITYVTNNELGFDYLKDNMAVSKEGKVLRGLDFCIIDEADSVLIDEARTPLIISGQSSKSTSLYEAADLLAKEMKEGEVIQGKTKYDTMSGEDIVETGDFIREEKEKNVHLTEEGIRKTERFFHIENLADPENLDIQHHIILALKANYLMFRDKDYVVKDGEVLIVDTFTGRTMKGRRYSDGLHQAVEAKEKVDIRQESMTYATITFQNFFNKFKKKSGMTGTAKTEEKEFKTIYSMPVVVIPTNKPVIRKDNPDIVYKTREAKEKAIIEEIKRSYEKRQPVLVGTATIESSERLSSLLKKEGIPHNVLNAKYVEKEAAIIAEAGKAGSVTIATNMAGRGTDIKLDDEARAAGGLKVIGSERHEARRIDNQLRGRSGRQGDPGESQFFVSMDDDLMRLFGSDKMKEMFERAGYAPDEPVQDKVITKGIETAQKRVENNNLGIRERLMQYDEINNEQREIIYAERNRILDDADTKESVLDILHEYMRDLASEPDISKLKRSLPFPVEKEDFEGKTKEEAADVLCRKTDEYYEEFEKQFDTPEDLRKMERLILLRVMDQKWMSHIDNLEKLRESIQVQAYGQRDPLTEYKLEAYDMFEEMLKQIKIKTAETVLHIRVKKTPSE